MRFQSTKMRFTNAKSTWQDEEPEHHIKVDTETADLIMYVLDDRVCGNYQNGNDQLILIISFLAAPIFRVYVCFRFRISNISEIKSS